jgi:hypothetical protein
LAIYTDGIGLADVIGLVAAWQGALPVVRLTSGPAIDNVRTIGIDDAAAAAKGLRSLTSCAPGVAAVDLSGNGDVIAMLLDALPRWGRLMLAGPYPAPFTTAFYTDIHRKGVVVCSAGDLDNMYANPWEWNADLRNACRLVADPNRAAKLRSCVRERL